MDENQSQPIQVRLHNDGPMKWPLWISDNQAFDNPRLAPLSEGLRSQLLEWTRFYQAHVDDAWDSEPNTVLYNMVGRSLAARVAAELGPEYVVLLSIEETSSEKHGWIEIGSAR